VAGRHEIIGILDAGGDALKIDQRAERLFTQPGGKLMLGDGSKD
jgi:hypothetical protein